jgi:GT2 family glycosyltransferase
MQAVRASVVIVAYRSGAQLLRCLDALADHDPDVEVIVVDNGAEGDEIEQAGSRDGVEVVDAGGNVGFATGCNLGARRATGDVLVFLNPDTAIGPGAITALARVLEDRSVGVAMPRLRLLDRPEVMNSTGCVIHISGLAWTSGYGEPAESVTERREIPYANGSALAIRHALFREVGGFTDEYFAYHEDLELCWKVRMRGLPVVLTPEADVFHDYDYHRHGAKNYLMERNRLLFVASAFSARTLAVLAPVLVATELALWALAWREGWVRDKLAGWQWSLGHAGWLRQQRRRLQRLRRVPDAKLASQLQATIDPAMIPVPALVRAANPALRAYWTLARRLL